MPAWLEPTVKESGILKPEAIIDGAADFRGK